MNCPICQNAMENIQPCSDCGWDLTACKWVLLGRFTSPSDLVIDSLLNSCGIPFKTIHQEINQFPFTVGPLAEILFFVPEEFVNAARELITDAPSAAGTEPAME